jgi:DNA-binding response OmpR family regulator
MLERNAKILIVEDDEDTLFLLKTALTRSGYNVETCTGGSGLVEFKHSLPDLFIIDKGLPTIDGLAITKFLKLQEQCKEIPIIMISAHGIRKKAESVGMNTFIKKPFKLQSLLKVVQAYMRHEKPAPLELEYVSQPDVRQNSSPGG